jgi:hypothetical protein
VVATPCCLGSLRGSAEVPVLHWSATSLSRGESTACRAGALRRREVRNFRHSVSSKSNPHPTLSLRRVFCLAPKALSQTSLGHRPRNSNGPVDKRCFRVSIILRRSHAHPASVLTAKVKSIGYDNPKSHKKGLA